MVLNLEHHPHISNHFYNEGTRCKLTANFGKFIWIAEGYKLFNLFGTPDGIVRNILQHMIYMF